MTTGLLALAVSAHLLWLTSPADAQANHDTTWRARTSWGDPDLHGEWTTEGEYGVPFERPAQFGTRQFLNDEEYAKRMQDVRVRDEQDLAPVDVLSGRVQGAGAPIPHWREYSTTSRRTSLVIDPPDGRLPPRTPQARLIRPQTCGSLALGEPCDSYEDYGLGVRCIVHGGGFPDAMIPAVYNANMRITQTPDFVVITYELIHDTRIIPLKTSPERRALSPKIRMYMGDARGHWDGTTLVVETTNLNGRTGAQANGNLMMLSDEAKIVEKFTRTSADSLQYEVTVNDPKTWTRPWTASFPLRRDPNYKIFEYACHEGNHAMSNILSAARSADKAGNSTGGVQ